MDGANLRRKSRYKSDWLGFANWRTSTADSQGRGKRIFEYYYNRNGKHQGHFHVLNRDTGETVFADRVDLSSREERAKLLPLLASITKEASGAIEQTLLQLAVREEERAIAEREARRKTKEQPAPESPDGNRAERPVGGGKAPGAAQLDS